MRIIGISGRKQAGKNTTANILHGIVLKKYGMIKDYNIGGSGELMVLTTNSDGNEGWGVFDAIRNDAAFVEYAEHSMWPHVKLYSFSDNLKHICVELFDIPHECAWGTDEQKNQIQEHLLWENMPRFQNMSLMVKMPIDARKSWNWREGPMTAREFMQFLGTDVMRKMYEPVHVNHAISRILAEQSELAIVPDVRFPNEVEAIHKAGGKVIRLTRNTRKDNHASECGLDPENFDWDNFDVVIHNDGSLEDTLQKVDEVCSSIIGQ